MKIVGHYNIQATRAKVWEALLDPHVLVKAMPGCERLEGIGPDEYRATIKIGIGAVKGTFEGKVKLSDTEPPSRYTMAVEGSGAPGFVRGTAAVELSDVEGGTRVSYDADIQVGGLVASVGQRLLGGVSKMMLDQFFTKISAELRGDR